jgi:hypothetical protein
MQKKVNVLVCGLFLLMVLPLHAQKSIDFDQISGDNYYASPLEITEEGETFVLTATGGVAGIEFSSMADFGGELIMGNPGDVSGTVKITITHKNGYLFDFNSIDLMKGASDIYWIIKGYKSGSQVSGSPYSATISDASYTTVSPGFLQVDEVTIEENPVYAPGFSVWCTGFVVDNVTDASLPVALSSFSAVCEGQSVILAWATESETDNLGFILERAVSVGAQNSVPDPEDWTTIASYQTHDDLKGQGNTSSKTEYAFVDTEVEPGVTYQYRVSDVSTDGKVTTYAPLFITTDDLPEETTLDKAYPNPFNPSTYIAYHLAEDSDVQISVYDMLGRKVQTLFTGQQVAGSYHVYWHGKNEAGNISPTGTYLIRMQTENTAQVQKVLLMK